MPNLELRLFGVPRLMLDGEEVVISRPRVFECLARVIVAGSEGMTRSELCQKLWPNFDSTNARAQLRGTLLKLRAELVKLGLENQFDLTGERLVVIRGVTCDFCKFVHSRSHQLADLRLAVQPLAKSWEEENWKRESVHVAAVLATAFKGIKPKDDKVALDLLRRAAHSHPTSTCLADLLIKKLEAQNRVDEANQAIITFEDAWVDQFGRADLPRLSLTSSLAASAGQVPLQNAGNRRGLAFLGLSGVCVLGLVFWSFRLPKPDLKVVRYRRTTDFGKLIEVAELTSGDSRVIDIRRFEDGVVSILTSPTQSENILGTDGRITIGPPYPNTLIDQSGRSTLLRESRMSILFSDGTRAVPLSGSRALPICGDMRLIDPKRVLARIASDDPFHSYHESYVIDSGVPHVIQPDGSRPRIVTPTFHDQAGVFVKYSFGQADGWHYHPGVFNLATDQFTRLRWAKVPKLDCAFVAYRSSNGTLVLLPEITDIHNGDYDTHWDGTVWLVHRNQDPVQFSIHGVKNFGAAKGFADSLILTMQSTSAYQHIQVVSIDGGPPCFPLPSTVADYRVSQEDCKALIYRVYDPKRDSDSYVLLNLISESARS